ncbi:MAG: 16S rRNA (guanine(966)-N(2))-methyltransferase RsmD [Candidatus Tectomicrobia bacterium]|uniref:16S rRNA (Guanine(966)-N(2))-methyltransferase RsmD n=1 Tax=Tectimicrobiota bacterium TaxID=2528274 RepID=A0A933GM70_UNCTE|nr:16S rRNA (guanine(966)-N(2))-methyltransferase RsmD [Candidatus Tectomicrobia bacterium]
MRIIAGDAKGRRLKSFNGLEIRPTYDRVRETLFNILGSRVEGVPFLDLFAGTGNVGLEALSRGASPVVFIESCLKAIHLIEANLAICSFSPDRYRILVQDVFQALPYLSWRGDRFYTIFLDPPYHTQLAAQALAKCGQMDIVASGGMVVAQHDKRDDLEREYGYLKLFRTKKIGDTALSFYK